MNESDTSLLWTLSQQFQFPQGDLDLSDEVWDNILRSRRPEKVLWLSQYLQINLSNLDCL